MGRDRWSRIVPDGLWEIAKPLVLPSRARPQGGGTQNAPDEAVFAANIYVRGRHYPIGKVHADKAYDRPDLRRWLRGKRLAVRIARKGIEANDRLGRHRWAVERTMFRMSGCRRLNPRDERHPRNYLDLLGLAAALCCYKRYVRLTT